MNPFITTKTKNKKNNNNHIWIWVMVIIIFLFLFSSYIFSQEYEVFLFQEDPEWQYIDYLSYKDTPIKIAIIDKGELENDQDYDLFAEYASGNGSSSWHGSRVISMLKSGPVNTQSAGIFTGICNQCEVLYADVNTKREDELADATTWAIDNGAQLLNFSISGNRGEEFLNVLNPALDDPNLFVITAGANINQTPRWGHEDVSRDVWSIGGLNRFQDAIMEGYATTETNSNIKFSAPAENVHNYAGVSDGTSYASPLFLGAVARILAYTNNGYSRSELYALLASYGDPIENGGYKIRWGDLIQTEFNISRTRKTVLVKDLNGNEVTLIIDLIYEDSTHIKSYLYRFEFDDVAYKIHKEL